MMDKPEIGELVAAVRNFLELKAMPELTGHTAFHARAAEPGSLHRDGDAGRFRPVAPGQKSDGIVTLYQHPRARRAPVDVYPGNGAGASPECPAVDIEQVSRTRSISRSPKKLPNGHRTVHDE